MDFNIAFTIAIGALLILAYFLYQIVFNKKSEVRQVNNEEQVKKLQQQEERPASSQTKQKIKLPKQSIKSKDSAFKHQWLAVTLKAHSDNVNGIDFSSNGKYLLSCGNDRALFLWNTKEFDQSQPRFDLNASFIHFFFNPKIIQLLKTCTM